MMGFGRRLMVIITSIVSIVDFTELYAVTKNPAVVTPLFTLALIAVTALAIGFNLWYWIPKYKKLKW